MSKFVKGFLLVDEVEPFLKWCSNNGIYHRLGKGIWQMCQVEVKVNGETVWSAVIRDKNNLISISDEVKLLVQRWKTEGQLQYTDSRMLDWLVYSYAVVKEKRTNGVPQYRLLWADDGEEQAYWYDSPREAIMAQMRAEGQ